MRYWIVALPMLAGCAQQVGGTPVTPTHPPMTQAQIEALRASEPQRAETVRQQFEAERTAAADPRRIQDQQAAIICRERGNMAAAQPVYTGPTVAGAITAGLQQGTAGEQVAAACWRAYEATGVMPSY